MNKEIKEKWVAALRSGDYKQGHGGLSRNREYCCLGVLCDLAVKAGVCKFKAGKAGESYLNEDKDEYDGGVNYLPDSVQNWAGIDDSNPIVGEDKSDANDCLAYRNDVEGLNFNQIADLIEKYL